MARYPLVRALLTHGEALEQASNDEAALATYERVLAVSPREAVARERRTSIWRRRAEAALKAGDLEQAQQAYEQATDSAEAKRIRDLQARQAIEQAIAEAEAYERREEWDQASAIYQRLMAEEPAEPRWHAALERIKAERDLSQEYTQATDALHQRNWPTAVAALSEIGQARPNYKNAAELRGQAQGELNAEAREREQREDWTGALALYEVLAAKMPQEEHWRREIARLTSERELSEHYSAGLVALRRRNWDEAFDMLSQVVRARPGYKDAEKLLARAERGQQGKFTLPQLPIWAAVTIMLVVVALGAGGYYIRPSVFPISAQEYYNRGMSRQADGKLDLAIADFTQAIALQPDYADAYHQRASAYLGKEAFQQAIDDFTKEITIDPQRTVDDGRPYAYMHLQQYDLAIADYTTLIDASGGTRYYAQRAEAYAAVCDCSKAIDDYTKAIELDPQNSALYLARGKAWVQRSGNTEAINDFKKVLEISTSDSEKAEAQQQLVALGGT
jgi:tetratricopeptide (TPR) repeat protein